MVSKKLLIGGGVATVGSVGTAVVVAIQNGAPSVSTSEATDSPVEGQIRTDTDLSETPEATDEELQEEYSQDQEIEQNRKGVRDWLEKNKGPNNWQVQIKEHGEETAKEFEKGNPGELSEYLKRNTVLLKYLADKESNFTFVFENDGGDDWKIMPTTEQITKWVKKISNGKATLKLAMGSEEKLEDIKENGDINKLFEDLFENKEIFEDLRETKDTKNILFELNSDGDWVHSKTEIKEWESTNKYEIKIGEDKENATALDQVDEEDLIGLLDYLTSEENKSTLLEFKTEKIVPLVLKVEKNDGGNSWNVVYKGEDVQDTQ